jgi:pilus assembly protein CpaE
LLKSLSNLEVINKERVSLVINRHLKKSDITLKEAEQSVQRQIPYSIPNDYKTTMSAINRGMPLHEIAPRALITRKIEELAESIIHGERKVEKKGWFFRK